MRDGEKGYIKMEWRVHTSWKGRWREREREGYSDSVLLLLLVLLQLVEVLLVV